MLYLRAQCDSADKMADLLTSRYAAFCLCHAYCKIILRC